MKALVCYESEFGNTHVVAEAIARGLRRAIDARSIPIDAATDEALVGVGLLVIGGPTHVHGLSRPSTRRAAIEQASAEDATVTLDPDAESQGIRAWFDAMPTSAARTAAFDTRVDRPRILTGRASKGISERLRGHGFEQVVEPESFLVSSDNHLLPGEEERAEQWGEGLVFLSKATSLDER